MRILVVFAHPVETSYGSTLHAAVVERLRSIGHAVDDCNLYAERFDPVLTREEHLAYHDVGSNRASVAPYVERLLEAEALVLVHPVWNFGYPAVLKGFFDRVFLPGVSFEMKDGKAAPCLHNIRKLGVVATYGGSRLRALLMGDPPRRVAKRTLRAVIRPGSRVIYLALYDMNRSTAESRASFLQKVDRAMRAF